MLTSKHPSRRDKTQSSTKGWERSKTLLAILAVGGIGLWLCRDLPRQWVLSVLEESLEAQVSLDRLVLEGIDGFRLEGLEIASSQALPFLKRAKIDRVQIQASLGQLRKAIVEDLVLQGARIDLQPGPPPPSGEPSPQIRRLRLREVEIFFDDGSAPSGPLHLFGEIRGIGTPALVGEVQISSPDLALAPVLALLSPDSSTLRSGVEGSVAGLEGLVTLTPRGVTAAVRLAALSACYEQQEMAFEAAFLDLAITGGRGQGVLGSRSLSATSPDGLQKFSQPEIHMGFSPFAGDEGWSVETEIFLAGIPLGAFSSDLDLTTYRLHSLEGSFADLPLEPFLPWLGEFGIAGGKGKLRGTVEPLADSPGTLRWTLALDAPELAVSAARVHASLEGVKASGRGTWDLRSLAKPEELDLDLRLRVERLSGDALGHPLPADLFPGEFRWQGRLGREGLEGRAIVQLPHLGRIQSDFSKALPGQPASGRWTWSGSGVLDLLPLLPPDFPSLPQGLELGGSIRGQGAFWWEGSFPSLSSLRGAGRVPLDGLWLQGIGSTPWSLSRLRGAVAWNWHRETLDAHVGNLQGEFDLEALDPIPLELGGTFSLHRSSGRLLWKDLALSTPHLLDLRTEGAITKGGMEGSIAFSKAALAPWRDFLRPMTGELASGLTLQGKSRGELSFIVPKAEDWSAEGSIWLEDSGFSSEDGSRVLEGLESHWRIRANPGQLLSDATRAPVRIEANGEIGGFQLLFGTFFADFSDLTTAMFLEAESKDLGPVRVGTQELQGGLRWEIAEGAVLTAGAVHREGSLSVTAVASFEDLEGLLDRSFRTPLLAASSRFENLELAGDLELRVQGKQDSLGEVDLRGTLRAEDLFLSGLGPVRLQNLRLELPVHLRRSGNEPWRAGEPSIGSLGFRGLEIGGLALEATTVPLAIHGDSLSLSRPLILPVAGGRLVLEDLSLVDLLLSKRHLETALALESLDLELLSSSLGAVPLEGRIDGRLPRIRLDRKFLEVEGGGKIQLFGGLLEIGDISGQDLLSRYPKLTFSADFQDLDLGKITRRFDVGEMTGGLRGSLRDCELFRSVLVRCSGRFETVELPGAGRTISVKAINNIAILGTGQGASFLDRGIASFFDHYTYSRLGVEMSLAQDVFLLKGLETRGKRELFLKGRLPLPIDVVNAQPGRTVSFQTMLRRLKSLDFGSAVTTP